MQVGRPEEWQIRQLLWTNCRGCRYLGIQKGLTPDRDIVLFNDRLGRRSHALFVFEFLDAENAVAKVTAKLNEVRR